MLEYLKNGTMVGLLPVPHPILIRKYQTSENTEQWFHTYIWGVIYVRLVFCSIHCVYIYSTHNSKLEEEGIMNIVACPLAKLQRHYPAMQAILAVYCNVIFSIIIIGNHHT